MLGDLEPTRDVRWDFPAALWLLPHFQQGGLLPSLRVALWVRPSQALFSLSACPAPKGGIAETREARAFTEDLHIYVGALLIFSPGFCPFLVVFILDLVYGCGGERLWLQELRWSCCHQKSGFLCGTFLPGWSPPEPALNWGEEWVGHSC